MKKSKLYKNRYKLIRAHVVAPVALLEMFEKMLLSREAFLQMTWINTVISTELCSKGHCFDKGDVIGLLDLFLVSLYYIVFTRQRDRKYREGMTC